MNTKSIDEDIDDICQAIEGDILKLSGKNMLITGSCGFLGSWFVALFQHINKYYLSKPLNVTGIDSFISTDKQNYIADIKDKHISLIRANAEKVKYDETYTYIIHAAGIASPIYYRRYPIETIDGMVLGLSSLLKHAIQKRVEGFLYFSSSEIYGNPTKKDIPMKETYNGNVSCIGPRSCYDEAKRLGETLCMTYYQKHNVPITWVRPFNIYGAGMRASDDRVIPKFIFQGLRKEAFTVHLPATQTRTFCYVTDAMKGFMKALFTDHKGEVFNIGQSEPEMTMKETARCVNKTLFDNTIKLSYIDMPREYPSDQAQRRCPDITKAKTMLQYDPVVSIHDGLLKMFEWAKTQKYVY